MQRKNTKKGFTLIEMLVVIAIIAVLVAIIIPTVNNATTKAKAAADAANLRAVLGHANTLLMTEEPEPAAAMAGIQPVPCKTHPGAEAYMGYVNPGFMVPFYVLNGNYYSLDYFAEIAQKGKTEIGTAEPSGYTFYKVGGNGEG